MTSPELFLPVDTEANSSFLTDSRLHGLRSLVSSCGNALLDQKKRRDILRKVQQSFSFDKVFSTQGVQGIAGILKVKGSGVKYADKVVFKISIDLNRTIEHENLVSADLVKLRKYSPHFIGNIGMINIPVSNDFVNCPDKESLFKNSVDYFPCNVLLIEYVSPISLYHVCKYLHQDRSLIISQLVQILLALEIGQSKCKLTSYDLHLENVLIRRVEEDTLYLYRNGDTRGTKGRNILIPTYGFYPVIIDLGSSYVKAIEGHPMYTSADNYHNGLQPTLYDNLNDVHHLLISTLEYLEDKSYTYDFLHTRFLYLFRHIPILSRTGWKQLPYDILDLVLRKIKVECPEVKKYSVYRSYDTDIMEILNGLIILPWSEKGELSFATGGVNTSCMEDFLGELQKIHEIKAIDSTDDVLYILRETVDSINEHTKEYLKNPKAGIASFVKDWKARIMFIISNNMKAIPKDMNFELLFTSALKVADRLSANYYKYVSTHTELISKAYIQTSITGPWDAAKILLQNATPSFNVTASQKIYIWDSKKEEKIMIIPASLTQAQLAEINIASIFRKGDLVLEYLEINGQI